jgi:hypothetical protein
MVIGNRCGNIRAPDAVEVLFLKRPSSFRAGLLANLEKGYRQFFFAPVAQLDRAPGYEPGGRGFESLRAHHYQRVSRAVFGCCAIHFTEFHDSKSSTVRSCGNPTKRRDKHECGSMPSPFRSPPTRRDWRWPWRPSRHSLERLTIYIASPDISAERQADLPLIRCLQWLSTVNQFVHQANIWSCGFVDAPALLGKVYLTQARLDKKTQQ